MTEKESPLDSNLQGGHTPPFLLGYTDSISEEESPVASQKLSESMLSQREFLNYPSDASQVSTSSISHYSTDSELDLFDQNFATSIEGSYPIRTDYNGAQLRPFQDSPQFSPSFEWISESRSSATRFPGASSINRNAWEPLREPASANTPPSTVETFNESWGVPLNVPNIIKSARQHNQAFDITKVRASTRTRAADVPLSPRNYDRKHASAKLRTAHASRSPTSPNIDHPKASLKRAHNQVEKQYRNRLNGHFASLLAKLPVELAASSGLEMGGKNVSKAETLALAERYIGMLQEDAKELVKKNKRLEEDYDRLRKAWIDSGENFSLGQMQQAQDNKRHSNLKPELPALSQSTAPPQAKDKRYHKDTERQYWLRLNERFSALLKALPDYLVKSASAQSGRSQADKALSKIEILALAKSHITSLEQAQTELKQESSILRGQQDLFTRLCGGGVGGS
ncbi:hypothetical protein N431DRAFT_478570 [Stipitochalara longipes BDJ]|nr:hypothetical protein N431DRAFT_478570 [Stipitochalara longipes BDJ]